MFEVAGSNVAVAARTRVKTVRIDLVNMVRSGNDCRVKIVAFVGIRKFALLLDACPLKEPPRSFKNTLPVWTSIALSASPERRGQDDSIHMHVPKYVLLVVLVSCSEIMRFNYRRFRTWMMGSTAVAGGAESQPRIHNNASSH